MMNLERIIRAQQHLNDAGFDAIVATSPANLFYFTGVRIDPHERLLCLVLQKAGEARLIAPQMHEADYEHLSIPVTYWADGTDALRHLTDILPEDGRIGIDGTWTSSFLFQILAKLPAAQVTTADDVLIALRLQKDAVELQRLRKISKLSDEVMMQLWDSIRIGQTERQVAAKLTELWEARGVYTPSFEPIIGVGSNGALPHHRPDDTPINDGDAIVIDMGAVLDGYCSDMTRTVIVGTPSPLFSEVYEVVQSAQDAAVRAVRPGLSTGAIDAVARRVIEEAGYGSRYIHGTGHGVGIDIHEAPSVKPGVPTPITPGMVFSIEPGIYLPNQFGVRIEDLVIVTPAGCERLNEAPRELQRLG